MQKAAAREGCGVCFYWECSSCRILSFRVIPHGLPEKSDAFFRARFPTSLLCCPFFCWLCRGLHYRYRLPPYLGIAVFISTTLGDVELAVNSRNTAVPILTIGCINLIDDKQHSTNAIYLSCYNRNCLLLTYHISVHALFVKLRPYCPPH